MNRVDRVRLGMAVVTAVLGLIVAARGALIWAPPMILPGLLLLALGAYRLRQYLRFRSSIGTH